MTTGTEEGEQGGRSGPTMMGVAWKTILVFILISLGLVLAAYFGAESSLREIGTTEEPAPPPVFEPPDGVVESWMQEAAQAASRVVRAELDQTLDEVFAPVHEAVPGYADFHYSVLGEYIELTEAATRSVSSSMQEQLFEGFDDRLKPALGELGDIYAKTFQSELDTQIEEDRLAFDEDAILGTVTRAVVDDTIARASIGLPADVLAAGAGAVGAKAVATALGKALMKSVAKVATKSAAKPLGMGGGATAGAGIGSFVGPAGTIIGGVVGAGVGWLAMDYAVVKIDEFISRDAFEADLHELIDAEQAALRNRIEEIIERRTRVLSGDTIKDTRQGQPGLSP